MSDWGGTDAESRKRGITHIFSDTGSILLDVEDFNPIHNGPSWGCSWMMGGGKMSPLPKICYMYPTMMKLDLLLVQVQ